MCIPPTGGPANGPATASNWSADGWLCGVDNRLDDLSKFMGHPYAK